MGSHIEDGRPFERESSPPNEIHRAVSEKIQRAISSMLNQRIEELVEQKANKKDLELAADRLFSLATQGTSGEQIESELRRLSSKLAAEVLGRDS